MVAWRSTYAHGDVNVNSYESLDSEYEDKSLSSEQLKISLESDLSERPNISTAKPNSSSSRKVGRKAVWRENVIVWYGGQNLFQWISEDQSIFRTLSVPETCVSQRQLGTSQQLLCMTFECTVALQSRWSQTLYNWVRHDDSTTFELGLSYPHVDLYLVLEPLHI